VAKYIVSKNISLEEALGLSPEEGKEIFETTKQILKKQLSYDIMKHIEITQSQGDFGEPVLEARVFVFDQGELKQFTDKIRQQVADEFIYLLKGTVVKKIKGGDVICSQKY